MNFLINSNHPVQDQLLESNDQQETSKISEHLAAGVLILYTFSALFISAWSALIISSGNIEDGGPIGLLFNSLKISGIL